MPHLLRHGPTLYNGQLRGAVTVTPVAERLGVELELPFFTTQIRRDRGSNSDILHPQLVEVTFKKTNRYNYSCL